MVLETYLFALLKVRHIFIELSKILNEQTENITYYCIYWYIPAVGSSLTFAHCCAYLLNSLLRDRGGQF